MIFAFVEDGTVEVLEGPEAARLYEPIDVESQVFVFYDEDGTWLQPKFAGPSRRGPLRILSDQRPFKLERSTEKDPVVDPFSVALNEAVVLKPNKYFPTLEAIRQYVASRQGRSLEDGAGP
jgi:hypothetical protein